MKSECCLHKQDDNINKKNEKKTLAVIILTTVMMVVEISGGWIFGSMGLLADGIHMGTHAIALLITFVAYIIARKNLHNTNFSFGTGRVGVLGGFTSAILLMLASFIMAKEAIERLIFPVNISFNESIMVAIIGLLVNLASLWLLGDNHHHHGHDHHHHKHDHHNHKNNHKHHGHHHEDHNIKAAYLHVLADALTSITAIVALIVGKFWGAVWLDPVVAIAGSILVFKWAYGLIKETGGILVNFDKSEALQDQVYSLFKEVDAEVTDLHIWQIDSKQKGLIAHICSQTPLLAEEYKEHLRKKVHFDHITVEIIEK